MPRKRLPEEERREKVHLRLKKKHIEELRKHGTLTEVIERAILEYLKNRDSK